MFWKIQPFPQLGDKRTVVRFAWLPIQCEYNKKCWFSNVIVHQVFQAELDPYNGYVEAWITTRCVSVEAEIEASESRRHELLGRI